MIKFVIRGRSIIATDLVIQGTNREDAAKRFCNTIGLLLFTYKKGEDSSTFVTGNERSFTIFELPE